MINKKFGKWLVIREVKKEKQHGRHYECQCECKIKKVISGSTLRLGKSTQCKDCAFKTHGMSNTNIYRIWAGLLSRCYNKKVKIYKYYGRRGIKVCNRWKKFENFYEDMGDRPFEKQIDRINNDGNYEPDNCRWVTSKENNPSNKGDLKDDMPGKKFGKWTILKRVKHKYGHRYYLCRCVCSQEFIRAAGELRRGKTTQCKDCKNISHRGWSKRRNDKSSKV